MKMSECDVFGLTFNSGTLKDLKITNSHMINVELENCNYWRIAY